MPNLLMSNTSLGTTARRANPSPDSRPQENSKSAAAHPNLGPLRRQVSAIIDAILSDTKPEEAHVREKLRRHVANNPGQPEKALLGHLLTVKSVEAAEQQAC